MPEQKWSNPFSIYDHQYDHHGYNYAFDDYPIRQLCRVQKASKDKGQKKRNESG